MVLPPRSPPARELWVDEPKRRQVLDAARDDRAELRVIGLDDRDGGPPTLETLCRAELPGRLPAAIAGAVVRPAIRTSTSMHADQAPWGE